MSAPRAQADDDAALVEPWLSCRGCAHRLAPCAAVFSASEAGACAAWANPHGFVHEVLTVREAPGVEPVGSAETAHSWFPGTAWRHALCGGCGVHVGWAYDAVVPGVLPDHFVGLRLELLGDGSA